MRCCAKHDRIYSMILNGASLPENYCIGCAYVDKHISTRCLEVIETVANQLIFVWSPHFKEIYRTCGSGAAWHPVVRHHVVLSETPGRDPSAIRGEGCVVRRRPGGIAGRGDGTFHGPVCELAEHTEALCLRAPAMDRVVGNQI